MKYNKPKDIVPVPWSQHRSAKILPETHALLRRIAFGEEMDMYLVMEQAIAELAEKWGYDTEETDNDR